MRQLFRLLLVLLLLLTVALGLMVMWRAPTGPGADGSAYAAYLGGKPQGHVYAGVAEEPGDVNPFTAHGNAARALVLRYTHDTLLDRNPVDGELRPALAESYEVSADGATCTFTLRAGVTFSDGSQLTMADVLFGWQLAEGGHLEFGAVGAAFARIDGLEVIDERRFKVHFRGVHYAAAGVVGEAWIVANRRFFVDRVRRQLGKDEAMPEVGDERFAELLGQIDLECGPGTGPYALYNEPHGVSNWHPRQEVLLVRNEQCWRREQHPGCWNFGGIRTLFRESAAATVALLRGELDWFASPVLDELLASHPELADHYRKLVYDFNQLGCFRIVWNCERPPFDDPRVRRALGMLVDRDEIVRVFAGEAKPAVAHAKPGSGGYPAIDALPYDPRAASDLLREAGFDAEVGEPLQVSLLALQGTEPLRRMVDLFRDAARKAGVRLEVRECEFTPFLLEKKTGRWDGMLVYQAFDSWPDPYRFLHSKGLDNDGHWCNAEADRLAEAAQREFGPAKRDELWRQLHLLTHREQPATLIVHPLVVVLLNRDIQDVAIGPAGLITEWSWVAPELQRR